MPAPQAAVDAITAAAVILRAAAPAAGHELEYFQTLALVAFDLFDRLLAAGHPELAAPPVEEAVQAYRKLSAAGASVIDVSDVLMTLSLRASVPALADASMVAMATAAVDAARAAVDLLQAAVATTGADPVLRARLAYAQLTLAQRFIGAGRPGEAADPAHAAVTLYEALAAGDSGYNGLLAQAQALVASLG